MLLVAGSANQLYYNCIYYIIKGVQCLNSVHGLNWVQLWPLIEHSWGWKARESAIRYVRCQQSSERRKGVWRQRSRLPRASDIITREGAAQSRNKCIVVKNNSRSNGNACKNIHRLKSESMNWLTDRVHVRLTFTVRYVFVFLRKYFHASRRDSPHCCWTLMTGRRVEPGSINSEGTSEASVFVIAGLLNAGGAA